MFKSIRSAIRNAVSSASKTIPGRPENGTSDWGDIKSPLFVESFEDVPDDVQELPYHFYRPRKTPEPEDFSYIRTLGKKFNAPESVIESLQKACVENSHRFSVFVSLKDEVPGLRRLVIYGPGFSHSGNHVLVGVTDDGLLFPGTVSAPDLSNVATIMDLARGFSAGPGANMSLNKRSKAFSDQAEIHAEKVMDDFIHGRSKGSREYMDTLDGLLFRKALFSVMRRRSAEDLSLASWAIMEALSPEIRKLMRSTQRTRLSDAVWFSGADFSIIEDSIDPDAKFFGKSIFGLNDRDVSLSRVQAVSAYPLIAQTLMHVPSITLAIDRKEPLAPRIAGYFDVKESAVKRLVGLTWQRAGTSPFHGESHASTILQLPENISPVSKKHHRAVMRMSSFRDVMGYEDNFMERFSAGGSPWRHIASLEKMTPSDVLDFAIYLVDKLYVPASLRKMRDVQIETGEVLKPSEKNYFMRKKDAEDFLKTLTVSTMFEMTERWHRNLMRHDDRIVIFLDHIEWEPLTEKAIEISPGIFGRELSSAVELREQGKAENHCVGGYVETVVDSHEKSVAFIFSIERDGKVLATAEIAGEQKNDGSYKFKCRQVMSAGNTKPPKEVTTAADKLCGILGAMSADKMKEYLEALRKTRIAKEAEKSLPKAARKAGYDYWNDASFETAWNELSQYLPRSVRKAGLDAFVRSVDAQYDDTKTIPDRPFLWDEEAGVHPAFLTDDHGQGSRFWEKEKTAIDKFIAGDHNEFREHILLIEQQALRNHEMREREPTHDDYDEMPF